MNKGICLLFLCLLSFSALSGCGEVATAQPTALPEPTATPAPTATSIPGWEKFEGGGIELWLPESYEGGDLTKDVGVVVERLRSLGPSFEQVAQTIEANPTMFVIWVFDSVVGESGFLTNVNVTTEQVMSAVSIDTYLDAALQQFPAEFQVVQRDLLTLDDHPAGRVAVDFTVSGVPGKEVIYIVKDGTTIWAVTYATGAGEWEQRLPDFEESIQTLAIQP